MKQARRSRSPNVLGAEAGLAGLGAYHIAFSTLAFAASWLAPAAGTLERLQTPAAAIGAFVAVASGGTVRSIMVLVAAAIALPVASVVMQRLSCIACGFDFSVVGSQVWPLAGVVLGVLLSRQYPLHRVGARAGFVGAGVIALGLIALQLVQLGAQYACPETAPAFRSCGPLVPYALPVGMVALAVVAGIAVGSRGGHVSDAALAAIVAGLPGAAALIAMTQGSFYGSRVDAVLLASAGLFVLAAYGIESVAIRARPRPTDSAADPSSHGVGASRP